MTLPPMLSFGLPSVMRSLKIGTWFNLPALRLSTARSAFSRLPTTFATTSTHHREDAKLSSTTNGAEGHVGQSGRRYEVEKVLLEDTDPILRRVLLATAGDQKFVLKYIHEVNFEDLRDLDKKLRGATNHVRVIEDIILDKSMFVFRYFSDNLLRLGQTDLPLAVTKRILKDALYGIAELHDRDIVHTDIKPDNVFINYDHSTDKVTIKQVQLGDLEDAVYIPPGKHLIGKKAGNWYWRSPEAHVRGPIRKPADIFSFAIVCIYAVQKRVIFAIANEELKPSFDRPIAIIERQMSYFADKDGLHAFLQLLAKYKNTSVPLFEKLRDGFNKENPREPFALWKGVDADLKDLVCAMTNFDPAKRITAREALAHRWFDGV